MHRSPLPPLTSRQSRSGRAANGPPRLALTLDMDGPQEYARLWGQAAPEANRLTMYKGPLERFVALCQELGGVGTVFAIGRDFQDHAVDTLQELQRRGFEIGCHSEHHDYQLARHPLRAIRADIKAAVERWQTHLGQRPRGFRAPGHHLSSALLDVLESQGFLYDSSVLPSPPYYGAKALALLWLMARGRRSTAWLGPPAGTLAPILPYHPGVAPYRRGHRKLLELPISVATPMRFPVTGAALMIAPSALLRAWLQSLKKKPLVVLNLHAMDLVDPQEDNLPPELIRRQPELRLPLARRLDRLRQFLGTLATGRDVCTTESAALAWNRVRQAH